MRKISICILAFVFLSSFAAFAAETIDTDMDPSIGSTLSQIWNFIYHRYGLSGYPIYNAKLNRYDFYDINHCYTGSLFLNPLTSKWECYRL